MNDELKDCCLYFIVHRSYFIVSLLPRHADAVAAVGQEAIEDFVGERVGFGRAQDGIVLRGLRADQPRDARGDAHVPIFIRAKRVAALVSDRRQLLFQFGERGFSLGQEFPGDDGREIS